MALIFSAFKMYIIHKASSHNRNAWNMFVYIIFLFCVKNYFIVILSNLKIWRR